MNKDEQERGGDMPRAPNEKKIEAEKLYYKGMKLIDIAEKLGVPEGTVRSWKNRGKWGAESSKKTNAPLQNGQNDSNATLHKRKRGGQPGNQNAKGGKGGGAPLRNQNAKKHGAQCAFYWDSVDDEEREMIEQMDDDEEYQLITQLKVYAIRERRLMKSIKKYKEMEDRNNGFFVEAVSKTKQVEDLTDKDGKVIGAGEYKKVTEMTSTNAKTVIRGVLALESELTKVQRAKTKTISTLSKIRIEKMKIESEAESAENSLVHDWIAGVLENENQE